MKTLIDRKSITLKRGQVHKELLPVMVNTANVVFQFEHAYTGYHRRILLDLGEKGNYTLHRSIVLRSGFQNEVFLDSENFNMEHFDFQNIEMSTDEAELIIALTVMVPNEEKVFQ